VTARYHPALVTLHWLLAALILFSLGMGMLSLREIPNASPDKLFALRGHMVAGAAIGLLTLLRLAVLAFTARPQPMSTAGRIGHFSLYAAVLLMAASGFALALQAGLPDIVFGGKGVLPESFAGFTPRAVHGALARVLLALIAVHVLAALYHQLIRRDHLFARMAFGRR
jgi:cytochrome b561